jgi:hypothetical protein
MSTKPFDDMIAVLECVSSTMQAWIIISLTYLEA